MKIVEFGIEPYQPIWERMKAFTTTRGLDTTDELWLLEHDPVYTLGQAGKEEHIIRTENIPVIQSDRGGQVTYHGPGQLIAYVLLDLRRRRIGIKNLVYLLEQVLINMLQSYQIPAHRRAQAPGVYVAEKKIASIGLRVKAHCTYHGIALNVAGDLAPFDNIHPCGYQELQMTAIKDYYPSILLPEARQRFIQHFTDIFTCDNLVQVL